MKQNYNKKVLQNNFYKEPMGRGPGQVLEPKGENANWMYPSPNSSGETILKQVCSR